MRCMVFTTQVHYYEAVPSCQSFLQKCILNSTIAWGRTDLQKTQKDGVGARTKYLLRLLQLFESRTETRIEFSSVMSLPTAGGASRHSTSKFVDVCFNQRLYLICFILVI